MGVESWWALHYGHRVVDIVLRAWYCWYCIVGTVLLVLCCGHGIVDIASMGMVAGDGGQGMDGTLPWTLYHTWEAGSIQ